MTDEIALALLQFEHHQLTRAEVLALFRALEERDLLVRLPAVYFTYARNLAEYFAVDPATLC